MQQETTYLKYINRNRNIWNRFSFYRDSLDIRLTIESLANTWAIVVQSEFWQLNRWPC